MNKLSDHNTSQQLRQPVTKKYGNFICLEYHINFNFKGYLTTHLAGTTQIGLFYCESQGPRHIHQLYAAGL